MPAAPAGKAGEIRMRTAKIKTEKQMIDLWEAYKDRCDNVQVRVHDFSAKNSEFVSDTITKSITYTIKGFAVFCGMTYQNFCATYGNDPKFDTVIARIKEECELDARAKFELGMIDSRLAGLWMSNYGYSTKTEASVSGSGGGPLEIRWMNSQDEKAGGHE